MLPTRLKPIFVKPFVAAYYDKHGFDTTVSKLLINYLLASFNHRFDKTLVKEPKDFISWRPTIPEDWFENYGNQLTPTNAREFSTMLESLLVDKFKNAILTQITLCKVHNVPFKLQEVILEVRDEQLQLSEDDLPYETIRKRLDRFCIRNNIDYNPLKKLGRSVRKPSYSSANSARNDGIKLKDWCRIAGTSRRTFFRSLKNEVPTYKKKGILYVVPAVI